MFKNCAGEDLIDQLKFIADQGFPAFFDNVIMGRPVDLQKKIIEEADRLGLEWGPFVANADFGTKSFVLNDAETRDMLKAKTQAGIDFAKMSGCKIMLMVPGPYNPKVDRGYQTVNVIENARMCAGMCEKDGVVIVLEPLNPWDHPGLFLTKASDAFQICQAANSPSCKFVFDIYHQQITEGNLIPNIDNCWQQIAAFHIGDNPGRKEPGTGEINYTNVFRHIHSKGYQGILCMEHGWSIEEKPGELAGIEAYKKHDAF